MLMKVGIYDWDYSQLYFNLWFSWSDYFFIARWEIIIISSITIIIVLFVNYVPCYVWILWFLSFLFCTYLKLKKNYMFLLDLFLDLYIFLFLN